MAPRLSPNGKRLAFSNNTDIEIYDLERGTRERLNFRAQATNFDPVWTPDGRRLIFFSQREGRGGLFSRNADGSGDASRSALRSGPMCSSSLHAGMTTDAPAGTTRAW